MSKGIIINCLAVLAGGLVGSLLKNVIPAHLKKGFPVIFGVSAIYLGFSKVDASANVTLIIVALIVGFVIGELLGVDNFINTNVGKLTKGISASEEVRTILALAVITFCFSGTGLFGSFTEGLTGDASILISKSVLDFFTSMIFASIAGPAIVLISLPKFIIYYLIFGLSSVIAPVMVPQVSANFLTIGSVLTIIIGAKMSKMLDIKPANVLPSLLLVIILSILL